MPSLERLPLELKARICESVANIIDPPLDFQPDPLKQDIFFPTDKPSSLQTSDMERTYSSIYADLRSLALVSKDFTDRAQQVLFRIAVVGGPRCPMRLLKSLLLYPDNRRYIRSLLVTRKAGTLDHLSLDAVLQIHSTLRPLILTGKINELPNGGCFREFLERLPNLPLAEWFDDQQLTKIAHELAIFPAVADHVLRAIVLLCPKLTGFHLCCGDNWTPWLGIFSRVEIPPSIDNGPSNTFPHVTSLTLDYGAIRSRVDAVALRPLYAGGCPPNIERLTLMGNKDSQVDLTQVDLDYLHSWLRSNTRLRELRLVNGFDQILESEFWDFSVETDGPSQRVSTWNTILPLYQDTLEVLVFDGYNKIFGKPETRFGPSKMLSCLGTFKKLAYLKVPLHMLRECWRDICVPKKGQNILDLVQATLPTKLKKMDIVVFTEIDVSETYYWNPITSSETYEVRL